MHERLNLAGSYLAGPKTGAAQSGHQPQHAGVELSPTEIKAFENVNVYPLIAEILGLHYAEKIDSNLKILKPILKKGH